MNSIKQKVISRIGAIFALALVAVVALAVPASADTPVTVIDPIVPPISGDGFVTPAEFDDVAYLDWENFVVYEKTYPNYSIGGVRVDRNSTEAYVGVRIVVDNPSGGEMFQFKFCLRRVGNPNYVLNLGLSRVGGGYHPLTYLKSVTSGSVSTIGRDLYDFGYAYLQNGTWNVGVYNLNDGGNSSNYIDVMADNHAGPWPMYVSTFSDYFMGREIYTQWNNYTPIYRIEAVPSLAYAYQTFTMTEGAWVTQAHMAVARELGHPTYDDPYPEAAAWSILLTGVTSNGRPDIQNVLARHVGTTDAPDTYNVLYAWGGRFGVNPASPTGYGVYLPAGQYAVVLCLERDWSKAHPDHPHPDTYALGRVGYRYNIYAGGSGGLGWGFNGDDPVDPLIPSRYLFTPVVGGTAIDFILWVGTAQAAGTIPTVTTPTIPTNPTGGGTGGTGGTGSTGTGTAPITTGGGSSSSFFSSMPPWVLMIGGVLLVVCLVAIAVFSKGKK